MLKIAEISLMLRTREFTDIFIRFDEIFLVFTSKKYISSIYYTKNQSSNSNIYITLTMFKTSLNYLNFVNIILKKITNTSCDPVYNSIFSLVSSVPFVIHVACIVLLRRMCCLS